MKNKALTAKQIYEKQMHYDALYHQKRIVDLSGNVHSMLDKNLLEQSKYIIAKPCLGYRSVDLSDNKCLTELDAFEASNQQAA